MNQYNYELKLEFTNRQAFQYPSDLKEALEILEKDQYAVLNIIAPRNDRTVNLMQLTRKDVIGKAFEGIEAGINKFADDARESS